MKKALVILFGIIINLMLINNAFASQADTIKTDQGNLVINFLGHGSLSFEFNKQYIYIDPFSKVADYRQLPKADLILVTHSHFDHLDKNAIAAIRQESTWIIYTRDCDSLGRIEGNVMIMYNGENQTIKGFKIEAVPAYNIVHLRNDSSPYHPKGLGNGYIITFGNKRVYIAGDTEDIPEMAKLGKIDIAFLPMNLPYTMAPEQTAHAAIMVRPAIFYPYHYGNTDVTLLLSLLKREKDIEVRVRDMK